MIRTLKYGGIEERMTFPDSDMPGTWFVLVPKEDVERARALVEAVRAFDAISKHNEDCPARGDGPGGECMGCEQAPESPESAGAHAEEFDWPMVYAHRNLVAALADLGSAKEEAP